jgi:FtsP/CotA-like multicopper oxidase with cupredoxin domain
MDLGNAYINGMDYDIQPYTVQSQLGTHEVWEVVNPTGVDLPFHLQLNSFQVLAISGGELDYARLYTTAPAMKDTVIVPKLGSVTLLVPVQDFEGAAVFQCHILEHEDIGMMGRWQIAATAPGGSPEN